MDAPVILPARVGIVGLGLMGGSLARALKTLPDPPHVRAYSLHEQDLRTARTAGAVDESSNDAAEVVADVDLVVYATPLEATLGLLSAHESVWRDDAVITDVVSLKAPVLERMRRLGAAERYVGGHPMSGGVGAGFAASRRGLFQDVLVWLVRGDAEERAGRKVVGVWTAVGARPAWTEADAHDQKMAWVSHVPQLVANALARALAREGFGPGDLGPGGRDMTRLAGSSPQMWQDLLAATAPDLAPALRAVGRELADVARWLSEGDVQSVADLMARTRHWRGEE